MELQHRHSARVTPIIKSKAINKVRSNTTNAITHIFGLRGNEKLGEDKLEERESPKFSTISQDSSGGSGCRSQRFTSTSKLGNTDYKELV